MKIAVLASHALESIRNVVRLAAGSAGGKYRVVRQNMSEFLQFGRVFDKDGGGVESESNSGSATPIDVDAVGKGKGKGCFVCGRPGHAAKECKFNQAKGKAQGKVKAKNVQPDKNTPAKFEGECRHCGKKGHKWADCQKRLAEAKDKNVHAFGESPSTATVAAVEETQVIDEAGISCDCSDEENNSDDGNEAWVLSVERNDKPKDAETALVRNTPVRGTLPNVQLRNANGLSIPSGRKVMVREDAWCYMPKLPLCRATSKGLFSVLESSRRVVQKSSSETRTHGLICKLTLECNAFLCK